MVQNNPYFHEKTKNWYNNDNCSFEGNIIENVTSQFGLQQIIKEPTHILDNCSSSVDLTFASQANLLIELSGVYPSLHSNCHHQIIYSKFHLQVFYHPPYLREV